MPRTAGTVAERPGAVKELTHPDVEQVIVTPKVTPGHHPRGAPGFPFVRRRDNLSPAMFYLGKLLQLSGMVTAAWALVLGVQTQDMYGELLLLGLGAGVFVLGNLVLRRGQGR